MINILFGLQLSTLHKDHCSCNSMHSGEQNYLSTRVQYLQLNSLEQLCMISYYGSIYGFGWGFGQGFEGWLVGCFEVLFQCCSSQSLCTFMDLNGAKTYAQVQNLILCLALQCKHGKNSFITFAESTPPLWRSHSVTCIKKKK